MGKENGSVYKEVTVGFWFFESAATAQWILKQWTILVIGAMMVITVRFTKR
jgi:hypothetical protein